MSKNKTRTKDKYRVVYNDIQRLELENEFKMNEYIAIPRKQEIAQKLQLSERQIKIWFQNRRAKKRKQQKRRSTQSAELVQPTLAAVSIAATNYGSAACRTSSSMAAKQEAAAVGGGSSSVCRVQSSPTTSAGSQDTYQEPPAMFAAHEQRHQHHHHHHHQLHHQAHHMYQHHHQQPQTIYQQQQQQLQQQHQQQQQQHGHVAQSNTNYYDSSYRDQYNLGHRTNLDSFHQVSPVATTAPAEATGANESHQFTSNAQCWPSHSLSQSTSPQIATSPAIINHQFHLTTPHQTPPNLPTPVSPYGHSNAVGMTYTNGYPQQPLQPHQHNHQQQQHYIHHQQHSHHQAIMQPENIYAAS